jgi:hypothetical protein
MEDQQFTVSKKRTNIVAYLEIAVAYSNLTALCFNPPFSSWSITSVISAVDSNSSGKLSFLARHASTYLSSAFHSPIASNHYRLASSFTN